MHLKQLAPRRASQKLTQSTQRKQKVRPRRKHTSSNLSHVKAQKRGVFTSANRFMTTSSATEQKDSISQIKLTKLRSTFVKDQIDALIVPTADAHLSEYVTHRDKRREFISEFTGSAGTVVVTNNEALLWTDGRYFIQAEQELPKTFKLMKDGVDGTPSIPSYLQKNLPAGSRVGFDPACHSINQVFAWKKLLGEANIDLIPTHGNLIDQVWGDEQPALATGKIRQFSPDIAGETSDNKLKRIRTEMKAKNAHSLILSALDDIAWLFNLRGEDIDFTPVFLSYAVVCDENVHLFVDASKTQDLPNFKDLLPENTILHDYHDIESFLTNVVKPYHKQKQQNGGIGGNKIWIDTASSNFALYNALGLTDDNATTTSVNEAHVISTTNPVHWNKAMKNSAELEGMKQAHIMDATSVVEFLSWFEQQFSNLPTKEQLDKNQRSADWNEYTIANKLEDFRKQHQTYLYPSFDTISSIGANGAIVHYKPDENNSSPVYANAVYLLDSGAQYKEGTTDITRTFWTGNDPNIQPTPFQIDMYTRVLQGHIEVATAIFPKGATGQRIDSYARRYLNAVGKNYSHGTGHGVGCGLSVHEGPIGITPKNTKPLDIGMVLSNEPGYYHDGEFGIRIENLIYIKSPNLKYHGDADDGTSNEKRSKTQSKYLGFENLTLVPIDRKLIDKNALSRDQIEYLDQYHTTVRETIGPLLQAKQNDDAYQWLIKNTEPL